jgi:putative photosynthetic complex assembly protein 2
MAPPVVPGRDGTLAAVAPVVLDDAAAVTPPPTGPRIPFVRLMLTSGVQVVGFWWLTTGVIVAMQATSMSRNAGVLTCTALAGWGAWLLASRRHVATDRAATASFFGGALLWGWVTATLYTGWIAGPPEAATAPLEGPPGSLALAVQATWATWNSEVASLAAMAAAWFLTRGGVNRVGFWTYIAFWVSLQSAKLNIFYGVKNPGTQFLPPQLAHLARFFGPLENSTFLPASLSVLTVATIGLLWRASRATDPKNRRGYALVATLVALAVVEHLFLSSRWNAPFWQFFLDLRGH